MLHQFLYTPPSPSPPYQGLPLLVYPTVYPSTTVQAYSLGFLLLYELPGKQLDANDSHLDLERVDGAPFW